MRYQNWDVLVFPELSKVPQQEYKTTCQVVQDHEIHTMQGNVALLPTVTSFIPSLPAREGLRISIHSWQNPEMSRYILSLKRPTDSVVFEARLFIDGKIAGSRWFHSLGPWPTIIDQSVDLDKHGEFEKLTFPEFHREVLMQNYWSAGDDLGRIKVVIAEGFAREHLAYPFERVRNIVSFSFQHAPLDVLETSSIAWPNAAMWRQVSAVGPYYSQANSPRAIDAIEGHSHSPRHHQAPTNVRPRAVGGDTARSMPPPSSTVFTRPPVHDPFTGPVNAAFSGWRQRSSTDLSMPDYTSSNTHTRAGSSRNISDPMQIVIERRPQTLSMEGAFETLCEGLLPPANTPQTAAGTPSAPAENRVPSVTMVSVAGSDREPESIEPESTNLAKSASLLNARLLKVSSIVDVQEIPDPDETRSTRSTGSSRKTSRSMPATVSGVKRPRNVTPVSTKVIDDADEPRSSPAVRQPSRANSTILEGKVILEGKENDRQILGDIDNV